MTDLQKMKDLFKDEANLDYTEEGTEQENTWYIVNEEEGELKFNFKETLYTIVVNITEKAKWKELIGDTFTSRLLLKGLNLKFKGFNDNNKQGELKISSFRRLGA